MLVWLAIDTKVSLVGARCNHAERTLDITSDRDGFVRVHSQTGMNVYHLRLGLGCEILVDPIYQTTKPRCGDALSE